ncbi:armadillo-type protein [Sporodiniella umbellata]|nr:armadillo-type protein [Sporodiniella umbellata]
MSVIIDNLRQKLEALPEIENSTEIVESVASLKELSGQAHLVDKEKWDGLANACESLADAARSVPVRTPLGETNIVRDLATLLQRAPYQQTKFQIQALRVLGNLCFDNEDNRKRVKEAGVISTVSPYFKSPNKDLVRFLCGFYLNSSMDYAPIQIELSECGAAKALIELMGSNNEEDISVVSMAIKILDGLVAEEEARKTISDTFTVRRYIKKVSHELKTLDHMDNLQNLLDTLLQITLDDDNLQNEIVDSGILDSLLNFLENTSVEKDLDAEDKEKIQEIKKALLKVVIYATSTDSKMDELYNNKEVLSRFIKMMNSPIEIVQQCGVYALGNLARSDEHCIELVEKYKLSKCLLDLFQKTENATFQYAILGCLKHLCLPVPNKTIISNDNCICLVAPMLNESKDMLKRNQFLTIGIIKLLCVGNYDNAVKVINEGVLSLIVSFIKRVDDPAAKSEATRVLTNLVKTVWVEKNNNTLRSKLLEPSTIEPIIEMICTSQFPILKNDGIMALTLVFSDKENSSSSLQIVPLLQTNAYEVEEGKGKASLIQVLSDDICSKNELPIQIKCNACILLCKIVEVARTAPEKKNVIDTIKSHSLNGLKLIKQESELYKYTAALASALEKQ